MKSNFNSSPNFQVLARSLFAAVAVFALSTTHTFADVVQATYTTGAEVPVRSDGFTATGKSVKLTLNYAPTKGTQLMVVQNTGSGLIRGTFSNLAQGQTVTLHYRGATYQFVAHYYGGSGRDLVLLWTNSKQSLPGATLNKLDNQLVLSVKQSRGDPPFDKPTTLRPEVYKYRGRVLVEIEGSLTREMSDQIASLGGQVVKGWGTATNFRVWVPVAQLETLAGRADVTLISPARPSVTKRSTR